MSEFKVTLNGKSRDYGAYSCLKNYPVANTRRAIEPARDDTPRCGLGVRPRIVVMPAISDVPGWVSSACTRCGKCCTNEAYMGTLSATEADLHRWRAEGRSDILKYANVITPGAGADLWVLSDGEERSRCPFLRKDRGGEKYKCAIYETRPQACRGYPDSVSQMIKDECEILVELDQMTAALEKARKPGTQAAEDAADYQLLVAQLNPSESLKAPSSPLPKPESSTHAPKNR